MKLNLCSLLKAWPKLLSSLAGSLYVLGKESKVKESGGTCKRHFPCFTKYQACINLKSFNYLLFHLVWWIACSILFLLLTSWSYSISTFGSLVTKPCLTWLVKATYSVLMWAPSLRLPTHTAQIHKSLSWLSEWPVSVSLVQVKKKLRWWRHRADNEWFLKSI